MFRSQDHVGVSTTERTERPERSERASPSAGGVFWFGSWWGVVQPKQFAISRVVGFPILSWWLFPISRVVVIETNLGGVVFVNGNGWI